MMLWFLSTMGMFGVYVSFEVDVFMEISIAYEFGMNHNDSPISDFFLK